MRWVERSINISNIIFRIIMQKSVQQTNNVCRVNETHPSQSCSFYQGLFVPYRYMRSMLTWSYDTVKPRPDRRPTWPKTNVNAFGIRSDSVALAYWPCCFGFVVSPRWNHSLVYVAFAWWNNSFKIRHLVRPNFDRIAKFQHQWTIFDQTGKRIP